VCVRRLVGGDAADNDLGEATNGRVAASLLRIAAAPLLAAQRRLAFAMGCSARLAEDSVLADCSHDCISGCGSCCSAQLVLRFLMGQPTSGAPGGAAGGASPQR
jgi:hypothetical protein